MKQLPRLLFAALLIGLASFAVVGPDPAKKDDKLPVAFSTDGTLLAVTGYHEVLLHKADGSGLVARLIGISERIQSVAFSPDGKWLAVTGGNPGRFGEVQIWNLEKRKLKMSIPITFD